MGLHVLPKHYYTPIADYAWLEKNLSLWARPGDLSGVHWDLDEQLRWLTDCCAPFYSEVFGLRSYREAAESGFGPGFGAVESQVLHCFVRFHAPARIVEVGSGLSTVCSLRASEMNETENRSRATQLTCIEPFPRPALLSLNQIQLIKQRLQEVERSVFNQLEAGDLLFIDSSHAVKPGSDVVLLLLEVIPKLKSGVFVHLHDINLPYLYPRDLFENYFGWQETSLLAALLKENKHLKVVCSLSGLHYGRPEELRAILSDYFPQPDTGPGLGFMSAPGFFPSSTWLVTV